MAEFADTVRNAVRMCDSFDECWRCPLYSIMQGRCPFGENVFVKNCVTVEQIIKDWALAHPDSPYPTWDTWHRERFPDASGPICPAVFVGRDRAGCADHDCISCRNLPIPADVADLLGIQPREAADE